MKRFVKRWRWSATSLVACPVFMFFFTDGAHLGWWGVPIGVSLGGLGGHLAMRADLARRDAAEIAR